MLCFLQFKHILSTAYCLCTQVNCVFYWIFGRKTSLQKTTWWTWRPSVLSCYLPIQTVGFKKSYEHSRANVAFIRRLLRASAGLKYSSSGALLLNFIRKHRMQQFPTLTISMKELCCIHYPSSFPLTGTFPVIQRFKSVRNFAIQELPPRDYVARSWHHFNFVLATDGPKLFLLLSSKSYTVDTFMFTHHNY